MEIRDKIIEQRGTVQVAANQLYSWTQEGKFRTMAAYEFFRSKGVRAGRAPTVWNGSITPKHEFILRLGA